MGQLDSIEPVVRTEAGSRSIIWGKDGRLETHSSRFKFTDFPSFSIVIRTASMNIEVLSNPPTSGAYEEIQFEAIGNCIFVKFESDPELPWVGVFGQGVYGETRVAESGDFCLVLSRGKLYYLNSVEKTVIYSSDDYNLKDAVSNNRDGAFIAASDLYLHLFDLQGKQWSSERLSWDGIRNLSWIGNEVHGECWDAINHQWGQFSFNTATREVFGVPQLPPGA